MVVALSAALVQLQTQAEQERERWMAQMAELRRRMFGPRSEVLPHEGQGSLWTEALVLPVPPEEDTHKEVAAHKRRRCGRPAIDADLPVRRVEHDLSEQYKAGFERCTRIGEQTSRRLEYTPARLEIIETVRATYRCEDANGSVTVRTAQAAASPIAKSNAGAGLLAQVMVAKYADHTPLARQERIFARHGQRLSRQTLCDWVLACAHKLNPLVQALAEYVRSAPVIFSDDTTLALQQPPGKGPAAARTHRHGTAVGLPGWRLAPGRRRPVAAHRAGGTVRLHAHPQRRAPAARAAGLARHAASRRLLGLPPGLPAGHHTRGVLGARQAQVLRHRQGRPAGRATGARTRCDALHHADLQDRVRHPGQAPGRTRTGAQGPQRAAAAGLPSVAARPRRWPAAEVPAGTGLRLHAEQLGGTEHLRWRWGGGGGQQRGRACNEIGGRVTQELAVRRLRARRAGRGGGLQPDRDGAAERRGAVGLPEGRARAHRRPPRGPPARVAAPTPRPVAQSKRDNFRSGDKVVFEDRLLQPHVGTIVRINRQTATIHTDDGKAWRVSFGLLRNIVDV